MSIIVILLLLLLNLNNILSFDFKINLKSIDNVIDCGGSISKNDISTYPPCKTFSDLGNRIRLINDSDLDDRLVINIIVNDDYTDIIEIKENNYLGTINNIFKEIYINLVNENNKYINNRVSIDGSSSNYFLSLLNNSNSIIKFYGLNFTNWNSVFDYNPIIISYGYNISFENTIFHNSINILNKDSNNDQVIFNNCQFIKNNISSNLKIEFIKIKFIKINNSNFTNSSFKNGILSFKEGNNILINQCSFNNNEIVNNNSILITVSNYNKVNISNVLINNNNIQSILSIEYIYSIDSYIDIYNIQFNNNLLIGDLSDVYLFNFVSYSNPMEIEFNNIYIDSNQTMDGIFKNKLEYTSLLINNLTSLNKNSFKNIINVDKSNITITNSIIPSIGTFILGSHNNIKIDNNTVFTNDNSLITEKCNTINNQTSKCDISNKYNKSNNRISNKKIAIIVPIIVFVVFSIIIGSIVSIYIKKKKKQIKQQFKINSNKQNNIINEIQFEDSGEIDKVVANGGDIYDQNFLNDPDVGTTE